MDILVVESYMYFLIILLIVFGIFAVLFVFDILKVQQTKSTTSSAISNMSFEIGLQIIRQIEKDEMMHQRAPNTIGNKEVVIDTTCYDIGNTLTTILSTSDIFDVIDHLKGRLKLERVAVFFTKMITVLGAFESLILNFGSIVAKDKKLYTELKKLVDFFQSVDSLKAGNYSLGKKLGCANWEIGDVTNVMRNISTQMSDRDFNNMNRDFLVILIGLEVIEHMMLVKDEYFSDGVPPSIVIRAHHLEAMEDFLNESRAKEIDIDSFNAFYPEKMVSYEIISDVVKPGHTVTLDVLRVGNVLIDKAASYRGCQLC